MLDWTRTIHNAPNQIGDRAGPFVIISRDGEGRAVLTSGAPLWVGPIHTATVAEAKAAAQHITQETTDAE